MRRHPSFLPVVVLSGLLPLLLGACSSNPRKVAESPSVAAVGTDHLQAKPAATQDNDLDEYDVALVPDPFEPVNRATFWLNHQIYRFVLRPISKGYEKIVPKPVRKGIYNAYENVKFPVRLVNNALQGNFTRARQELEKFLINSSIGVGGIIRQSDRIPSLAEVPRTDTGLTFAKWGMSSGPYLVLPLFGPSTFRDTIGLIGDSALNPVTWATVIHGELWVMAVPYGNTLRGLPEGLSAYDSATENALDRYLAVRSTYIQYRKQAASR
jgi:phospholipid-binding lipoprotein MlaA